jgi:hypothetical protein
MDLDLIIVMVVLVIAAVVHPATENKLHRLALTLRFLRNGYSLRRAWRLSERHA